jgi:hypothetical protein
VQTSHGATTSNHLISTISIPSNDWDNALSRQFSFRPKLNPSSFSAPSNSLRSKQNHLIKVHTGTFNLESPTKNQLKGSKQQMLKQNSPKF